MGIYDQILVNQSAQERIQTWHLLFMFNKKINYLEDPLIFRDSKYKALMVHDRYSVQGN